ncbi:MAG: carboxypeptidase-like regulatory domain-containing protein [Chloroflexaceae bacterium]|jgi:hypothetical protein|nr:carboxypeptidase-like regulatory domain-containing protein [Chloroflexaceae bacterium]
MRRWCFLMTWIVIMVTVALFPTGGRQAAIAQNLAQGEAVLDVCGATRGTGVINGKVTDATTGATIPFITLEVYTLYYDLLNSKQTNGEGVYDLDGLATGEYIVRVVPAENSPYQEEFFGEHRSPARFTAVQVKDGQITPNINIALDRKPTGASLAGTAGAVAPAQVNGAISGRVTAADTGLPLANATVFVKRASNGRYVTQGQTGADGTYTIPIFPDTYKVEFRPLGQYAGILYNQKPGLAAADPVIVQSGQTTANINGALPRGTRIRGKLVSAATGLPITDVAVNVFGLDNQGVAGGATDINGEFLTDAAPAGQYVLGFQPFGRSCTYLGAYYKQGATNNTVTEREQGTVVIVGEPSDTPVQVGPPGGSTASLDRGTIITGRVTSARTEEGLSGIAIDTYDSGGRIIGGEDQERTIGIFTQPTGYYRTVALPAGTYRIFFGAGNSGYASSYYDRQGTLASATPIEVAATGVRANINAVLNNLRFVYLPVINR